jgi:CRISPR-associated protein Cmr5
VLTRDQKYATIVYSQVYNIKNNHQEQEYKKYGAMAHKLPVLIYTAGLAQALEFINTRGKGLQKQLLQHIAATVGQEDAQALLDHMRKLQLSEYMCLTQQILAALLWYKRFAQSILGVEASEATLVDNGDSDDESK